jgi:hypothetical protein
MLKVIAINGNSFEFDADSWSSTGTGLLIFKAGKHVAEFSSYLSVQAIPDQVAPEVEEPPAEPETPAEEPEPVEPETPEEEDTNDPES